jgi:hypothetical protein
MRGPALVDATAVKGFKIVKKSRFTHRRLSGSRYGDDAFRSYIIALAYTARSHSRTSVRLWDSQTMLSDH